MTKKERAKRGPGKPSLNGHSGGRSPMLVARLPAGLLELLRDRAEREGVTVSVVVRRILEAGLRSKGRA